MKINLILVFLVSSLLNAILPQPTQARNNQCLGKICIDMTESQVLDRLGKPSGSTKLCAGISLNYSQGQVSIKDGKTSVITTKNNSWRTEKGIKVGDNISKAQKAYNLEKNTLSSFSVRLPTGVYLFISTDKHQKIKEISLNSLHTC
jgi:hypothetical protein